MWEADHQDNFNQKILKVMCLNQAIGKMQREVTDLVNTRNKLVSILEECVENQKLEGALEQMKKIGNQAAPSASNDASKIFSTTPVSNLKSFEAGPLSNEHKVDDLLGQRD